jgi:uncharacterized protein (DUF2141 family)
VSPRNRWPRLGRAAPLFAVLAAMTATATAEERPGRVDVECVGLARDTGEVVCALFDRADRFPREDAAYAGAYARIEGGRAVCRFEDVPAGRYAAAVFHDEDGDRKLKTVLGMPREGYGFSNDARPGTFGPPKFALAAFDFDGRAKRVPVRVHYP